MSSHRSDKTDYHICSRCVMDTSDPTIEFDDNGHCNHCTRYFQRIKAEVALDKSGYKLNDVVNTIKAAGKNNKYDCVAGVSGGVDSTFILYRLKELGLRPLAIHFDNGWNSQEAQENINNVVDTLKVDLEVHSVDKHVFFDLQKSFLKASVPNCEIPTDHAITATLVRTAAKIGTPYVINGSNVSTEGILPISWVYYSHDLFHIKAIYKLFGSGLSLDSFPQISLPSFSWRIMRGSYRMVNLLNYMDFDKQAAVEILKNNVGWKDYGGKHFESIYTRWYQGHYLLRKFGIDKRRAHLSALICSQQITRAAALNELELDPYRDNSLSSDSELISQRLDLGVEDLETLISSPNKRHVDYPNRLWMIEGSSYLRNFIRKRAKKI